MRILICSNACPPRFVGGAELMAFEQARALARLGHDVRVFAGDLGAPAPRHARTDDVHEGIPLYRIATTPEDYSSEYLNFFHPAVDAHFRNVMEDFGPDIVHAHNLIGLSAKLPIIAHQLGARVLCTLHDFWGFCLRNTAIRTDGLACDDISQCRSCLPRLHDGRGLHVPLRFRKDFMRLALDHIDHFVAPSRHVANRYMEAGASAPRVTVIPNGIDVIRFHPAQRGLVPGELRITYAGYFGAHKGVSTLIEALGMISNREAVLELAGEGPEQDAYLQQAKALGLGERLRLLGKTHPKDMPDVYARSDIVVLPSTWGENQPVCLMEAMAVGLPVVASRRGGIPELVEHGRNGLLFTAGNARDLAEQLERLAGNPTLRQAMGREGRQRVEHLGHASQARRLDALYTQILETQTEPKPAYDVFGAIGTLRRKMLHEGTVLGDGRQSARYFMPLAWMADCMSASGGPRFAGVLLTGWIWQALRVVRANAILRFPRWLRAYGLALFSRSQR